MPTPPTAYITADDLLAALGSAAFLAIFDDDNTNDLAAVKGTTQVALVVERAHAEVLSYVPRAYDDLPSGIPTLLKSAELDYAVALSFERHPEYVRTFGEEKRLERWNRAERKMERIADAAQILTDNAPAASPATEGGVVVDPNDNRLIISSADGTNNAGDF